MIMQHQYLVYSNVYTLDNKTGAATTGTQNRAVHDIREQVNDRSGAA